jgi:hypothetical protein
MSGVRVLGRVLEWTTDVNVINVGEAIFGDDEGPDYFLNLQNQGGGGNVYINAVGNPADLTALTLAPGEIFTCQLSAWGVSGQGLFVMRESSSVTPSLFALATVL